MIETLNRSLFLWVNASSGSPTDLIDFARLCANGLLYLVPVILLGLWLWGGNTGRQQAIRAVLTTFIALGLGALCGAFYFHPRPFMVPLGHTWLYHAPENSFPSDHGTLFFSLTLSLLYSGAKKTGSVMLVLALLVAWSRVYIGVHFPMDMLGTVFFAALACLLVIPLWRWAGTPLTQLCERIYLRCISWLPAKWLPKL